VRRVEHIGDATLYLADCQEELAGGGVAPVNCVVTSPPYGAIRDYGRQVMTDFQNVLAALARLLKPGGVIMWNVADQSIEGSETGLSFRQALHAIECGLRLHDTMIYCKEGVTFPDARRYHPAFEYMFVFSKGAPAHFNGIRDWPNKWRGTAPHGTKRLPTGETISTRDVGFGDPEPIPDIGLRRNWWPISNGGDRAATAGHPASMPFSMAFDHIATWTAPGETVLDPFTGSGTTGVAALELGRRFVGIEIEERYFDIACRRIERAHASPRLFV
jgi:DNA modification methylase